MDEQPIKVYQIIAQLYYEKSLNNKRYELESYQAGFSAALDLFSTEFDARRLEKIVQLHWMKSVREERLREKRAEL